MSTDLTVDKVPEVVTKVASPLPPKPVMAEYGTVGINVIIQGFSGKEAIGFEEVPLSKLIQMCRMDGSASGILNIVKLPIMAAGYDITEFDKKSQSEAAWVNQNLTFPPSLGGMDTSLRYVFADMCMATVTGFRAYEKVWDLKGNENDRFPMYVLKKIAPRNPLTVRLKQDDHGNYDGFVQRIIAGTAAYVPGAAFTVTSANDQVIDKDKSVLFVRNREENPLYGRPDFLPVYYHYDKLHKLYYMAHLAYQLEAIPMRIGKYPQNADKGDLDKFFKNIAQLGFDTAMMMQQGYEVDEFGANRAPADKMGLINHHKTEMFTAFCAQFMNLGQTGASHGSFAATKTFSGIFLMVLEAICQDIDEVFNFQVIPQMIDYNFGSRKYPKLKHRPMDTAKEEAIQNIFMKIMSSPADHSTPEFLLGIEEELATDLGLKIDYDAIRAQRLSKLVQQSLQKNQVETGATKQLIDSLYFTEVGKDDDGNIQVYAYPTAKTFDVLDQLAKEARTKMEDECKKQGIDLSKLYVEDKAA